MATPTSTSEPYVFLSYTSLDRARTLTVADALEAAGIAVWVDRRDIAGGSSWDTAIVDGISQCAVFALACTPASLASPNVQQEVRLAWEEQRPILPLLLEQTPIPRELRYPLAGRQWVELLDRAVDAWLPEVLRALAGLGMVPVPPVTTDHAAPTTVSPPTNLPASLTSLLGREQELADLARLLAESRLVTLTGPGGTGKTRLAMSAAAAQPAALLDGVFFVDLATLADPTLVPSAVAQVLGVQGNPDLSLRQSVLRFLRDKRLLLVLDNYEHLLEAAEFAGALLQGAPGLLLLVTSRAPLRVPGEREYPVAPLPLPQGQVGTAAAVAENPAVALFVLRARDVRPEFVLTDDNAATVAAICTQLDGLPLAIELAAARVRVLPPAALLARLTARLLVLTGGARTAPARQQTLRGAIAWSYDLLEEAEQRLFRRLGVFAGGCTLELAEAVCNADGDLDIDVLDGVSSLLEKSLLREVDGLHGEPRHRMLETIREFALGELEASGEAETVRRQLAVQVLGLVRRAAPPSSWASLDVELDNARAVLAWCVERAELSLGVRLYWALVQYLFNRGHGNEMREWRRRLLALPEAAQPSISRARLLTQQPFALLAGADLQRAIADVEASIALSRALGDVICLAVALQNLCQLHMHQGRHDLMVPLAEEALSLYRAAGNALGAATMYMWLISAAVARGDIPTAEQLVAAHRELEGTNRSAFGLSGEAYVAEALGNVAQARLLVEESVRKVDAEYGEKSPVRLEQLALLAHLMLRQGDTPAAVATCAQSLGVQRSNGPAICLSGALAVLAQAAAHCGLPAESARLLAAVDAQRQAGTAVLYQLQDGQQTAVERARAALGADAFAAAWAEGGTVSADASIEYGLEVVAKLEQVLAPVTVADPLA